MKFLRFAKYFPSLSPKIAVAAIVVDMQTEFVKELRSGEADRIIPKQLEIIRDCNQSNIPIIVLELYRRKFGKTTKIIMNEVKKNPYFLLIQKEWNNGFRETSLNKHLEFLGTKKIFIMGINADFCVKETAEKAIELGYKIITSNEVISGQSDHSKDNSINWFKSNGYCIDRIDAFAKVV